MSVPPGGASVRVRAGALTICAAAAVLAAVVLAAVVFATRAQASLTRNDTQSLSGGAAAGNASPQARTGAHPASRLAGGGGVEAPRVEGGGPEPIGRHQPVP